MTRGLVIRRLLKGIDGLPKGEGILGSWWGQ